MLYPMMFVLPLQYFAMRSAAILRHRWCGLSDYDHRHLMWAVYGW